MFVGLTPRNWWYELDSNQRRRKPADLQSAPVGHLGILPAMLFERFSLERREPQISTECAVAQHFTEAKAAANLHEGGAERKWKDGNSMKSGSTFGEKSQII